MKAADYAATAASVRSTAKTLAPPTGEACTVSINTAITYMNMAASQLQKVAEFKAERENRGTDAETS